MQRYFSPFLVSQPRSLAERYSVANDLRLGASETLASNCRVSTLKRMQNSVQFSCSSFCATPLATFYIEFRCSGGRFPLIYLLLTEKPFCASLVCPA